jgi:hypothetical protein
MLWHTEPSSFDFSTVYRSGAYRIRHYVEPRTLGFGIICARLYRDAVLLNEFTGAGALLACQRAAEDSTKGEA